SAVRDLYATECRGRGLGSSLHAAAAAAGIGADPGLFADPCEPGGARSARPGPDSLAWGAGDDSGLDRAVATVAFRSDLSGYGGVEPLTPRPSRTTASRCFAAPCPDAGGPHARHSSPVPERW